MDTDTIRYEGAKTTDVASIERVLTDCGLPTGGIASHMEHFIVAKAGNDVVGSIGVEVYAGTGLLRSLAVLPSARGKGIGKELCSRAIAHAHREHVDELYLLTTTANGFLAKRGFKTIERTDAPASMQSTIEFKTFCPKSAVCMKMRMGAGGRP